MFLENLKENWIKRQKEVEERFLELEEQCGNEEPLPKKRKRGKKKKLMEDHTDPFANYAAQLQIEFFVKVNL